MAWQQLHDTAVSQEEHLLVMKDATDIECKCMYVNERKQQLFCIAFHCDTLH